MPATALYGALGPALAAGALVVAGASGLLP
jgi:hypothetical protein